MSFLKPKAAPAPPPLPPLQPQNSVPQTPQKRPELKQEREPEQIDVRKGEKDKRRRVAGKGGTILTSALGDTSDPLNLKRRTLLGS